MPTLNWIGKDKVLNHHLETPFHVLERKYSFDERGQRDEDNGSENMIIHGDNLLALKSLLPKYEGRIKCIYIDPPYNTGNENWVYNDNVNDPQIQRWLHQVVGKEGEDLSRHDKWLCMMYPRLKLLQRLLADDGAIFISIDDNEQANLKLICDEIFGSRNYIERITVIVKTEGRRYGQFAKTHENILVYAKNLELICFNEVEIEGKEYQYFDENGGFNLKGLRNRNVRAFNETNRPNLRYPFFVNINNPDKNGLCSVSVYPIDGYIEVWAQEVNGLKSVWRWGKDTSQLNSSSLCAYRGNDGIIRIFQKERKLTEIPKTVWIDKSYTSIFGTKEQKDIFGKSIFEFPKPSKLIERILEIATDKNSIVLDSFAGSGTTAHAVLNMNKRDGGRRKFICIEMMDYADSITAERVKRVIKGYKAADDKEEIIYDAELKPSNLADAPQMLADAKAAREEAKASGVYTSVSAPKLVANRLQVVGKIKATQAIVGTGGDFSYYELGAPLLIGDKLNEAVSEEKIRAYVYYMETRQALPPRSEAEPMLLGVQHNAAYYFYYARDARTVLNREFLHTIKTKAQVYVIYADVCALAEKELQKYRITFKKIPRDIAKL
ncbi:MAG: site-specific DNA-methyltransferase [Phascolarctobacterium sp.]|uniref:site-specific DNA-methyltransferase n=1 Tax=Phascolarctobacterium sp. TaxID=2049039 RepID=UPI0026DC9F45|nr:site-specific DNA-methyltransferase [Phascolarctobacterium sp.]MDO4921454.1 site-specific DNA-methyltransferase [Phascolarctobacterium sp.]